jgi:peptide subunit release factor RF-3
MLERHWLRNYFGGAICYRCQKNNKIKKGADEWLYGNWTPKRNFCIHLCTCLHLPSEDKKNKHTDTPGHKDFAEDTF